MRLAPALESEPEPESQKTTGARKPGHPAKEMEPAPIELSRNSSDLDSILGELEGPPRSENVFEHQEVDLGVVLEDIRSGGGAAAAAGPRAAQAPIEADDLDGVFEQLRGEASRQVDAAEAAYRKGLALCDAGRIDEAIQALQEASRAPRLRFQAASLLGRIHRDRKAMPQAIECFERAAQAPAPTADEGHGLLYDLADALESVGEIGRALAICLELQADAGDYRDISARADRLAKVQTRG